MSEIIHTYLFFFLHFMWEGFDWKLVSAICCDRAWSMHWCRKYICYWPIRVANVRCKIKYFHFHFHFESQVSLLNVFLNFLICRSTFGRIVRNKSTEHFSGLPYIYALLNCLICMWYGSPLVSDDNLLVMTVNSAGAVFQFVYIILFITYADKANKVNPSFLIQKAHLPFCTCLYFLKLSIACVEKSLILLAGEDDRISPGNYWRICSCSCRKFANTWTCPAKDHCGVVEWCFSHINVCFSTFCNCKFI